MMMINEQAAQFFNKPLKATRDVHDNAHSGSPYVLPQLLQPQGDNGAATHEKGTTWSVKRRDEVSARGILSKAKLAITKGGAEMGALINKRPSLTEAHISGADIAAAVAPPFGPRGGVAGGAPTLQNAFVNTPFGGNPFNPGRPGGHGH